MGTVAGVAPFAFRGPKALRFGSGEVSSVGTEAARLGTRALIVTGRASAASSGGLARVTESLTAAGIAHEVYAGTPPEPRLDDVERGRAALRESGADLVVALGGGSALDVGKAVAALGRRSEPVSGFHGRGSLGAPGLPCIAIPTTSGTGAEVTPNSVLTDPDRGVKTSIRGDGLLPEVAIVDPGLTLSLPPEPTAHSGLDALCQAIEAFVSIAANPLSDAWALLACERISGSLAHAFTHGDDLAAREDMALGSVLAGYALGSARLGLVHGLAHPVGTLTGKPHGLICGSLLGPVIRANASAATERYERIARAVGVRGGAEGLAAWVEELCATLAVPTRLSELGVAEGDLPEIARLSATAGSTRFNPRQVTPEALLALLHGWM